MKFLISLGLMLGGVLTYRYGMGVSTPHADSYYLVRIIGWCERVVTRTDFWLGRLKVSIIDRLELDKLAWIRLRARYTPEMS